MTRPKATETPTSAPGAATSGRRTSARSTGPWSPPAITDLLAPYFALYRNALPLEIDRTKLYYGHAGASYPETMYFFGAPNNNDFGWGNKSNVMVNTWIRNHIVGGVETVAMMLGQYDNTQDAAFAKQTLLPVAEAVTTYYDRHWPRGAGGKIHMDPAQAVETYQQAVNPAPDIAGLQNILPRLLALPPALTTAPQRTLWHRVLTDLPPLPLGTTGPDGKMPDSGVVTPGGKPILLPAEKYSRPANVENPELYAVFPFRRYGVGFPDLELARNTYAARRFGSSTCWGQDGEDAALLALPDAAQAEAVANFTAYGGQRFPWFWRPGHDWIPDMDNGGAGMSILQLMLMQCDGKRIQLLPAWPAAWNADFKLHAPDATTVARNRPRRQIDRPDRHPRLPPPGCGDCGGVTAPRGEGLPRQRTAGAVLRYTTSRDTSQEKPSQAENAEPSEAQKTKNCVG